MKKLLKKISETVCELGGIAFWLVMCIIALAACWASLLLPWLVPGRVGRWATRMLLILTGLWIPVMIIEAMLGLPSSFDD